MRPEIYILTISLPLLTAVIVFAMKYAASYAASRARLADERELSSLTDTRAHELREIKASLKQLTAEFVEQSRALANVESILKQVG